MFQESFEQSFAICKQTKKRKGHFGVPCAIFLKAGTAHSQDCQALPRLLVYLAEGKAACAHATSPPHKRTWPACRTFCTAFWRPGFECYQKSLTLIAVCIVRRRGDVRPAQFTHPARNPQDCTTLQGASRLQRRLLAVSERQRSSSCRFKAVSKTFATHLPHS